MNNWWNCTVPCQQWCTQTKDKLFVNVTLSVNCLLYQYCVRKCWMKFNRVCIDYSKVAIIDLCVRQIGLLTHGTVNGM